MNNKFWYSVTFLLLPTWYTNFLFIHINYIKLNSSTCFERNPPIIRRLTQNVHMSPSLAVAQDDHLQRVTIPEAAYVQFSSLTSWWWADCAWNMQRNLILCNLCEWTRNLCIKLVIIKKLYYDARPTKYQDLKFSVFFTWHDHCWTPILPHWKMQVDLITR